jgi:hypothetical protein
VTRLKWKLVLVLSDMVLILTQDRCTACVKCTIGSEIILDAPDGTPRWCGSCEIHLFLLGDRVSVGARLVHGLCQTYHRLRNHFGHTHWYHKVTRLKWKLISVLSDILLILTQDRCTVCIEHVIGSKIILDTPNGTPRWHGSCEISLDSLWRQC